MYWDATSKTYIPVPGGSSAETQPGIMTVEDQAILSNPAADAPLEMKKSPLVPPLTTEDLAPVPVSAASSAPEPVPTSTATPEKKDDEEDSAKKDKEEKPRSLAAVKVALESQ